jgi:homoserine dehydrogenase
VPEREIRVGLVGFGTIGTGVVRVLHNNADRISERLGFPLRLVRIADIDLDRDRRVPLEGIELSRSWKDVTGDPEIDLVVELVGGTDVARSVVMEALEARKRVVTANKALLAHHGEEIFGAVQRCSTDIAFEASVGGTIPVLRALREGLCADRIESVWGIVNGTCNFILTEMEEREEPYEVCLKRAQEEGYAEADPTYDVDGTDSAHKLAIIVGLAFGLQIGPDAIHTEGIERITPVDIEYASSFGLRVKLLAIAKVQEGSVEARVHPTMLPEESVLGRVGGSMNAIEVRGEWSGPTLYYGAGAGSLPTASAVVADIMELARSLHTGGAGRVPPLGTPRPRPANVRRIEDLEGEYYLRLTALDRPGVLSRITGALGGRGISIASVLQPSRSESEAVPVVLTTHTAKEAALRETLLAIDRMGDVTAPTQVIRIEREI